MKFLPHIVACALTFFLVSCSDGESTTIYVESPGFAEIPKGKSMPKCTLENVGELYFVADSNALFCCANEKWNRVVQSRRDTDTIYQVLDTAISSLAEIDTVYLGSNDTLDVGCTLKADTTDYHLVTVMCGSDTFSVWDRAAGSRWTKWEAPLVDSRDGSSYKTVVIGTQTWMAENLKYKADSVSQEYSWLTAMNFPKDCDGTSYCELGEMPQGICPNGWHIPSVDEWNVLADYVDARNGEESVPRDLAATSVNGKYPGNDLFDFGMNGVTMTSTQTEDSLFYVASMWGTENTPGNKLDFSLRKGKSNANSFYYAVRCVKND